MSRLSNQVSLALGAVQAVAVMVILRSVVFHRWTTIFVASALLLGANAALRDRTWGIGAVLAAGVMFPVAATLGFAPTWFWIVGAISVVPFLLTLKPMMRFDVGAASLFGLLAAGAGVAGAFAWREAAYALFFAMQHHAALVHHSCH